ncbi:MAG: hypothetical protein ABI337_03040 [Nitrososphaera sp.]
MGISDGTANVCITHPNVVSGSTMEYWTGSSWASATAISVSGTTICGNIPVSALTGTNISIGSPSSTGGGGGGVGDRTPPSIVTTFGSTDYPVSIGGSSYTAEQLNGPVLTKTVGTFSPLRIKLLLYDNGGPQNISHVEMYVNRHGTTILNDLTETYIMWDNNNVRIINPHGILSDGTVTSSIQGNKNLFTFDVTFAKEFDTSDIVFVAWDANRNPMKVLVQDAIRVIPAKTDVLPPQQTTTKPAADTITPDQTTTKPAADTITPDQTITIKRWAGFDSESATDGDLLESLGIKTDGSKNYAIPSWVKNSLGRWAAADKITPDDLARAIKYLYEKGVLVSKN